MLLSLATTQPSSSKVRRGGKWGMLKSHKDNFLMILSQNVRHNPHLVGGLVNKLSTVYGMQNIILVSFSYGSSLPLKN